MGKWNPWSEMDELRQQMERLFDEAREARNRCSSAGYVWAPVADVLETAEAVIVQVELPGIAPEQVVVELHDGDLLVRGERPCEHERPGHAYIMVERAHGAFSRRFALPTGVDGAGISAVLSEGLLTVTIPRSGARGPRRFAVMVE
jgi:HSP20 family protein